MSARVAFRLAVVAVVMAPGFVGTAQAATPRTWYVRAGATTSAGTAQHPVGTLAQVESSTRPGDTIVVLPASGALDGGLQLKANQTLRGSGGSVQTAGEIAPRLTNTTSRLDGDAVRLADGVTVSNVRVTDTLRGAIYGLNVTGVRVTGTDVSGQNQSCTTGYLIPQFNAPTNVPGVGIPITGGLPNGWAGIMVDATSRTGVSVTIDDNEVHHAECGDGIDIRFSGTATGSATIAANRVHHLRQGNGLKSVLAIGLQSSDSARLSATVDGNAQSDLGNDDDPNFAVEGADSEGVFLNAVGPATLDATVSNNTYTNENGWGGFSANGLEMVSMGSGARMNAVVRDSSFSGSPGDIIEHGALGTDAVMTMTLERVVAERSAGVGNTILLPFNNGDCVLAGSLGARNIVRLTVRDSVLRDCRNNGLSVGSNVVNGSGPTTEVALDVADSTITGNRGSNLGVRNFTKLDRLKVKVQRTNLSDSKGLGSGLANFSAEDLGSTTSADIDLGRGSLGSVGENCFVGGTLQADVVRYRVSARANWWGRPTGPALGKTIVLAGSLDASSPLATAPESCG
ncbi:MAG TPA: hypothetical protein VJ782_02985 [Aeromicrobium sp.]|nr:hypothetical protein [Aeromicrobium sp.]